MYNLYFQDIFRDFEGTVYYMALQYVPEIYDLRDMYIIY